MPRNHDEGVDPTPGMVATPESAKRQLKAMKNGLIKTKLTAPAPARRWTKSEDSILARAVEENGVCRAPPLP